MNKEFKNPAMAAKIDRLKAEEKLFPSILPKPYVEVIAYIEKQWGVSKRTAKNDIEIHVYTNLLVLEKGMLKLKTASLSHSEE